VCVEEEKGREKGDESRENEKEKGRMRGGKEREREWQHSTERGTRAVAGDENEEGVKYTPVTDVSLLDLNWFILLKSRIHLT